MVGPYIAMCCSVNLGTEGLKLPADDIYKCQHCILSAAFTYRIVFIESIDGEPRFPSGLPLSLPLPSAAGRPICWRETVLSEHPSEAPYFAPDRFWQLPGVTLRKERVTVGRVSLNCLRAPCDRLHKAWRNKFFLDRRSKLTHSLRMVRGDLLQPRVRADS